MNLNKDKFEEKLFKEIKYYEDNGKEDAINFLIWFLVNFYRLDEGLAYDLVCDHKNDKGIDGIYVDDDTKDIILFQSKLREKFNKGDGDGDLRKFIGSLEWFKQENLETLDNSRASKELKDLVKDLKIYEKLNDGYIIKGCFLTSGYFDKSAQDYIKVSAKSVDYWDSNKLFENYTFSSDDELVFDTFAFRTSDNFIEINHSQEFKSFIIVPHASELLNLKGITDQSLFSKNVRYGLGKKTSVNKAIAKTIKDSNKHKNFALFHNGITIICEKAEQDENDIRITNYSIVNGCQSTLTLYENREYITEKLKIPVKIIETGKNTKLSEEITYFANNQNPIKPSDLRSREKFQIDIKNDFNKTYLKQYQYKIKKGEKSITQGKVIENTFAAQLIHSYINESPYNSHLKTTIFTNNYDEIFTRHINAHLVYFLVELYNIIELNLNLINIPVVRSYQPTKFFIMYVIKNILKEKEVGDSIMYQTKDFLITYPSFRDSFDKLVKTVIIQFDSILNIKSSENGGHVEYKNILRNSAEVKKLSVDIITGYKVLMIHQPDTTLEKMLENSKR